MYIKRYATFESGKRKSTAKISYQFAEGLFLFLPWPLPSLCSFYIISQSGICRREKQGTHSLVDEVRSAML